MAVRNEISAVRRFVPRKRQCINWTHVGTSLGRHQFVNSRSIIPIFARGGTMTGHALQASWLLRLALPVAVAVLAIPAYAQGTKQTTSRPTHIPTVQQPNSPFGTGWAKPAGTTGSYIYNDLRLADPYSGSMN